MSLNIIGFISTECCEFKLEKFKQKKMEFYIIKIILEQEGKDNTIRFAGKKDNIIKLCSSWLPFFTLLIKYLFST